MYENFQTNRYFKTDEFSGAEQREQRPYDPVAPRRSSGPRQQRRQPVDQDIGLDEDEEIRRAIEMSKATAKREEQARIKEAQRQSQIEEKKQESRKKDDFEYGSAFDKQTKGQEAFEFGEQPKKQPDDFNFNFGAEGTQKQGEAPTGGDLLELDFNAA